MPSAEIITIGTEILLGEIIDTNARYLARQLRDHGVDVYRTSSIGDNADRIADALHEALVRADFVITTGGLGPTIDDPTREAVAQTFGVKNVFSEVLWQQVIDRFARWDRFPPDNNKRQAFLPVGAKVIVNPVGTAPAFLMEALLPDAKDSTGLVISLPGVPREMEHLMEHDVLPFLRDRFEITSVLHVRVLHTAGAGESAIDEKIGDLEALHNPTVGLAAHAGTVDVRIAAKADSIESAQALILPVETEIRARLGKWVYGADDESLESIALEILQKRNWKMVTIEAGLEGKLVRRFASDNGTFLRGEILPTLPENAESLLEMTAAYRRTHLAEVGLGVALELGGEKSTVYLALITPEEEKAIRLPYGGPPKLAARRAINYSLDLLRKIEK